MKILVEASLGLGDIVEATPLCHALYLLGHDVDLYLNTSNSHSIAPLFTGWPALGQVCLRDGGIDYAAYDLGISTFGFASLQARFPAGLCYCVHLLDVKHQPLWVTEANLLPARLLGYAGPLPAGHVQKSARNFDLPENTVIVHAGCNKNKSGKRWPHWPAVCAKLKSLGHHVIIVGTDEDRGEDNWEALFDTYFNLPLPDLAALLDQATLYLGNDSAIGHIAAALGLPGLLLFGPSNHVVFRPNSKVMRTLVAGPYPAHPELGRVSVPDIKLLGFDPVWNEITSLLNAPGRDPARQLPLRQAPPMKTRFTQRAVEVATGQSYPVRSPEYVFSASAGRLLRGRNRQTVIEIAGRRAGNAYLSRSHELLKKILLAGGRPTSGMISRGRYYANCGIRAGRPIKGRMLLAAFWIIKRLPRFRTFLARFLAANPSLNGTTP